MLIKAEINSEDKFIKSSLPPFSSIHLRAAIAQARSSAEVDPLSNPLFCLGVFPNCWPKGTEGDACSKVMLALLSED
ncbi:hypothetical protein B1F79_01815 [Coxiella-like endosymbiont of Rhipicephalus sanguineus]|nr:hypothetical protein [Coxiella-like endosymbiont of Rhipicephalus sanguineus]